MILCRSDNVSYSCQHRFHTACILKNDMSLFKPTCPVCEKGKLIYIKCQKQDDALLNNKKELDDEASRNDVILNVILLVIILGIHFILMLRQQ